jgi:ABC-type multidrug transport system fused ATPase/permease subunit
MNKLINWFIAIMICVSCSSCFLSSGSSNNKILKKDVPVITEDLNKNINKIGSLKDNVINNANGIKVEAVSIDEKAKASQGNTDAKAVEENLTVISDKALVIQKKADSIVVDGAKMEELLTKLNKAQSEIAALQKFATDSTEKYNALVKENIKLNDTVQSLKNDAKAKAQKIWWVACAIGMGMIVIGIFLLVNNGNKLGVTLVGSGLATISVSYFLMAYAWIIAIIGGIIVVGGMAYVIYDLIQHKKELSNAVLTAEVLKTQDYTTETKNVIKNIQTGAHALIDKERKQIEKIKKVISPKKETTG